MNNLVDRLTTLQEAHNWTDGAMAGRLGISRSYWVRLRQEKRTLGRKVLVGVVKAFPELADEAVEYLRRM